MHERNCPQSLSGVPDLGPSSWFLFHNLGGGYRGRTLTPPIGLFAEAGVTSSSVQRNRQERSRGHALAGHRLVGTWSRSRIAASIRYAHAPLTGQAPLPRRKTSRLLTFRRGETGHRPSPQATPQNWAAQPMRHSQRPMLHQSSAALALPEQVQLAQAQVSSHSSEVPGIWPRPPRTCPLDIAGQQPPGLRLSLEREYLGRGL